ncbi:fasciclin domain-containing protein [Hymenobacter busanensis]|uniref:Fasciclin domain-containing protein n=1 Tax=Hymenobacter busanensis TaxID=2607656 RepID=A0A7L4ZUE2_9BACT|nr:fasciclin domain-containing protein [Hymenobacter busanensis]KAA9339454.1 fasciclin domain-containing protein [Hymenobacter busanensis]QHJ06788.1 fasciclin domain-containing protein [Hymenobacter busanensis]
MPHVLRHCFLGLVASCLLLTSCDKKSEADPSIAGIAVANPDFSTLENAAVRGGVVEVLTNKNPDDPAGNFTVFAPNNAAFSRLGLNTADDLNSLQKDFLTSTLLYHVANGTLAAPNLLPNSTSASAFKGVTRRIINRGGYLYVNGSRILLTDVKASNGTIHIIDKVLLATNADIVQSAVALASAQVFVQPELTYLVEAVLYCDLAPALTATPGSAPLTVYAPTDQAFKNLLAQLLGRPSTSPADIRLLPKATVTAVLLNHVVAGGKFTSELPEGGTNTSLGGGTLTFGAFTNGTLPVRSTGNGTATANMVIPDVQCTNGVVHVIDKVLLP